MGWKVTGQSRGRGGARGKGAEGAAVTVHNEDGTTASMWGPKAGCASWTRPRVLLRLLPELVRPFQDCHVPCTMTAAMASQAITLVRGKQ